jgi:hypothetical protein
MASFALGKCTRLAIKNEGSQAGGEAMETKRIERRTVLKGGMAAVGVLGGSASTAVVIGPEQASAEAAPLPDQILAAVQRFRESIPAAFDRDYVEKAIILFS